MDRATAGAEADALGGDQKPDSKGAWLSLSLFGGSPYGNRSRKSHNIRQSRDMHVSIPAEPAKAAIVFEMFIRTADENYIAARWAHQNNLLVDFFGSRLTRSKNI